MIKFFRTIRKNFLKEGKTINYFKYAIGEIVLVVVGILIALQINNWNENRKSKKEFNFGITEFYKQFLIDVYGYNSLVDRYTYQVSKMDSIIDGKTTVMNLEHLPGILQIFDDNGSNLNETNTDWQQSFLKLNPDNDQQNEMVKNIRKYFQERNVFQNTLSEADMDNLMIKYLRNWNIPVRFLRTATWYNDFIADYPPNFYSETELSSTLQLTNDPSFIADLKSLNDVKKRMIGYSMSLYEQGLNGLDYLKQVYPNIKYGIGKMEVLGTATPNNDWTTGIPMQNASADDSTWKITMQLTDGAIKFRTDAAWTFDWGMGQSDPTKLVFKGPDIPVKKGKYHITIDIVKNTYEFKPID
jgi:hypothetical protein